MPKPTPEEIEAYRTQRQAEKDAARAIQIPAGRDKVAELIAARQGDIDAAYEDWKTFVRDNPMGPSQHQFIATVEKTFYERGRKDPVLHTPGVEKNADDVYHEQHGLPPRKGSSLLPITDEERGIGRPKDDP